MGGEWEVEESFALLPSLKEETKQRRPDVIANNIFYYTLQTIFSKERNILKFLKLRLSFRMSGAAMWAMRVILKVSQTLYKSSESFLYLFFFSLLPQRRVNILDLTTSVWLLQLFCSPLPLTFSVLWV